jgi:hypothetical protein
MGILFVNDELSFRRNRYGNDMAPRAVTLKPQNRCVIALVLPAQVGILFSGAEFIDASQQEAMSWPMTPIWKATA